MSVTYRCYHCSTTRSVKQDTSQFPMSTSEMIKSIGWKSDTEIRAGFILAFCSSQCHLSCQVVNKTHLKLVQSNTMHLTLIPNK